MSQRRLLHIILGIAFCTVFALGISQNQTVDSYKNFLTSYEKADRLYREAVVVSEQENYTEAKETQLNQQALQSFQELAKKLPSHESKFDSLSFFVYFKMGELQHYFENLSQALLHYRESITIKKRTPDLPDSLLFRPYLFSGIIHSQKNHFDSALWHLQLAEKIKLKYSIKLNDEERLFNNLGALHFATGNFRQAKNYFEKAAEVLPKNHPHYKDLLVNYYINIASAHTTLEEYDAANIIYQKIISQGIHTNEINHNIGMINLNLGAAEKALRYFRKVSYANNRIVRLYADMGLAHFNLKQNDSAAIYYEKAREENRRLNKTSPTVWHGVALKNSGDLEVSLNKPLRALEYYQQALHQFYPSYKSKDVKNNPEIFSGVFSYINLFNTLTAKADALHMLYKNENNISRAIEELIAYRSAFKLIDYVERSYDSDEARLFLNNIKYVVHSKPIDIAFELYDKTKEIKYLEEAFFFDQKNKASVLSYNQQLNANTGNTDSLLLQEEKKIRSEITRLSLKAAKLNDSIEIAATSASIREYEIALGRLQEKVAASLGNNFNDIPSVKKIQKEVLDDKAILISFHLSEEKLTSFIITKKTFSGTQKAFDKNWREDILQLISSFRKEGLDPASITLSKRFYKLFFNEIIDLDASRLIIIPDDELNYLPFEALSDSGNKYLIQNFSVQYQHSTALLKKEDHDFKNNESLSFAPFAQRGFNDSAVQFTRLPHSSEEIENIEGDKLQNEQATKKELLKRIHNYPIVHLATHAQVNTTNENLSFIAFSPYSPDSNDYLLYAQEIYDLPLRKTQLIVLSACETGAGTLHKGEGVISLSRAFLYAGCSNIITSLWKADDESTAYLSNKIHFYLNKSYSIDQAIQQAKLDYLADKNIHPRKKHPAYWAHLVFIGNYSKQEPDYWWLLLIPVVAAIMIIVIKKSRKKNGT